MILEIWKTNETEQFGLVSPTAPCDADRYLLRYNIYVTTNTNHKVVL